MTSDREMLLHRAKIYVDDPSGTRKELGVAESIDIKTKVSYVEYTKPGLNQKRRKASLYDVSFTIGVFQGTTFFSKLVSEFIETSIMPKFSILGVIDDPDSSSGRRSVLISGCVIEEDTLVTIGSSEDVAKYDIPGYAESYDILEDFVELGDEY